MSSIAERQALLALLTEACDAGARLKLACTQIGLSERTVQRWQRPAASDDGDLRASTHLRAPGDRPAATHAALRQRVTHEGRGDAGYAAAARRGGLSKSACRE